MTRLVIVGAGGHGRELLDIVEAINAIAPTYEFLGFLDERNDHPDRLERRGVAIVGSERKLLRSSEAYLIGIGDGTARRRIDAEATEDGVEPVSLVHPDASVGSDAVLRQGSVVFPGGRLTTNVTLGRHTHINTNASVSHDCVLGDYVSVSPGVTLSGGVTVGDGVFLGAGATVLPSVHLGAWSTIGAGAVVVHDVEPGTTVVGVPARPLGRNG